MIYNTAIDFAGTISTDVDDDGDAHSDEIYFLRRVTTPSLFAAAGGLLLSGFRQDISAALALKARRAGFVLFSEALPSVIFRVFFCWIQLSFLILITPR